MNFSLLQTFCLRFHLAFSSAGHTHHLCTCSQSVLDVPENKCLLVIRLLLLSLYMLDCRTPMQTSL